MLIRHTVIRGAPIQGHLAIISLDASTMRFQSALAGAQRSPWQLSQGNPLYFGLSIRIDQSRVWDGTPLIRDNIYCFLLRDSLPP